MRKQQVTVAVIDDDPSILGSVRELLNAKGFITEPFASAEGFLASGVIPRVDCLLLDIRLLARLALSCGIIWTPAGPSFR
jgi:FixJ family two-component response regulator